MRQEEGIRRLALNYLLRIAPLARAMVLMRLLDGSAICAVLRRVETLGLEYCKRNATYFEQIRKRHGNQAHSGN